MLAIGILAFSANDVFPKELVDAMVQAGPFCIGSLFGCFITIFAHWMAGRERLKRQKLEQDYVKTLLKQIKIQQDRLDELHKKLSEEKK